MIEYTMQYLKKNGVWLKRGPFDTQEEVIAAILAEPTIPWSVLEYSNGMSQFPIKSYFDHLGWYGNLDELQQLLRFAFGLGPHPSVLREQP